MEGTAGGWTGTDVRARSSALERQAARARVLIPALEKSQARIAVGLFRMLAEGKPVAPDRLAERLDLTEEQVAEAVAGLPAVFSNEDGRIISFWGLSLQETRHRIRVDGRSVFAWCFADSLFFPRILGKTVRVESTSPTTGEPGSLVVRPDGVESVSPAGAVLSFVSLEGKQFDNNVIRNVCHYNFFFASEDEGRRWAARQGKDILILTIEEGFDLMGRIVVFLYGKAVEAR
jgi:alkylmercury lyase